MIRFLADSTLIIVLAVGAAVLLYDGVKKQVLSNYPYLIMAGLTSLLVGKLLSVAYQPDVVRPFLAQGVAPGAAFINNPGFPSDHALLGTATVLGVYVLTGRKRLSLVLAAIIVVMMIARVVALVHTPLDILGGAFAGLVGGLWYLGTKRRQT
jgi:membrane-associated phospholipid phosphatase